MSTVNDLFNPKGAIQEEKKNAEIYQVSYKNGKNGVYKAIIRFVPFYGDPNKSIMGKYVSWVKNPLTGAGMYVDDPRTKGDFSPVSDMYWKMNRTGVATYIEWGKQNLGSKKQYASLVQIMADEQRPELVGQIKVFIYGQQIWDKLHNEEFPQGAGQTGQSPFHPILGRKFSLICTNQSNFNNYGQSEFFDEKNGNTILPSGMWYIDPANPNNFSVVDENTDGNVLLEYLTNNSPDLSKFDFHPWTEEQTRHVEEVLKIAENLMTTGSMAMQAASPKPAYNPAPQFPGAVTPTAPAHQAAPVIPTAPAAPVAPATPSVQGVTLPPTTSTPTAPTPPSTGVNMDDVLKQL